MDLSSALTMEGPLQKQSPSLLKAFQSRYFAIRGKGEYLVWFKKKPSNPDQNPQGIINIDTISEVRQVQGDDRIFKIEYLQRKFTLRAETEAVKVRWVNSLKTIIAYHRKLNKNRKKQLESVNQSWKWNSASNKEISEQIRLENEQVIMQDSDASKNMNQIMLTHILKEKAHEPDLQKCMIAGSFQKKGILSNSTRWFFLVSNVNLYDQNDEDLYPSVPQLIQSLVEKKQQEVIPKETEKKKRKKLQSSSDSEEQKLEKKKVEKKKKTVQMNVLYEYDEQSKILKHSYNLLDFLEYQMVTNEQPFCFKFFYEEMVNEQEEEVKQIQIILLNNFMIEIKKINHAINIIFERFSIAKQRQKITNTRSKRYLIKKWKFDQDQSWVVPEKTTDTFTLLVNRQTLRLNKTQINLTQIQQHKIETFKSPTEQQKQQEGVTIKFKEIEQKKQRKINLIFKDKDTIKKFMKKLSKNIKKIQQETESNKKTQTVKQQAKKVNPDTYLIDKKVRQTQNSIKVNFYDLMDREIIQQKNQTQKKDSGFWGSISAFFCATGSSLDADV